MAKKLLRSFNLFIVLAMLGLLLAPTSAVAGTASSSSTRDGAARGLQSASTPQAPPIYYLNDPTVADAPYTPGSPTIDGMLAPGEYSAAHYLSFPTYGGGITEAFIVQNAVTLTIGINSTDLAAYGSGGGGTGPALQVYLDSNYDHGTLPKADDYRLSIDKGGIKFGNVGNGSAWVPLPAAGWNASSQVTSWGWQAEVAINFSMLGILPGANKTLGLALAEVWTPSWPIDWYWPKGANWMVPNSWGTLVSSSYWGEFYWKPGPWLDYAPSGIPDFDQRQSDWFWQPQPLTPNPPVIPTHCGPVAAANSLWWFDSKFESHPLPPPNPNDTYRMVKSYNTMPPFTDDHDPSNVVPFVDDLADNYFDTNKDGFPGTNIITMTLGLQKYLRAHGLWDDYSVTLVPKPSFQWVASEVLRSEDVILLLGIWKQPPQGTQWQRLGGHYVTVAGVNPRQNQIAFSDPWLNNAEDNLAPGRILTGTLIAHSPIPGHSPDVHNDAGNVSQDIYNVADTASDGGIWGPVDYPVQYLHNFIGVNPHPTIPNTYYVPEPGEIIQLEVEYALAVSPFRWKASGYWDPKIKAWTPWQDYAPNGLPDFGQLQDNWKTPAPLQKWSFCGPAAAANSLWWFDSKFEPFPANPALGLSDHYALLSTYAPATGVPWDDHAPSNVDNLATPWPPGGELVENLASYFHTDLLSPGTVITDVYNGLNNYLVDRKMGHAYLLKKVQKPSFWWVADEVIRSEDVILLLGFWQGQGAAGWQRLGGHYVTAAGVDRKAGYIAFSDPWYDRMELTWPFAGMDPESPGFPLYTGRVASGWLLPHIHIIGQPPDAAHNDAGNISHDIYRVRLSPSPGGTWGPIGYATYCSDIENFIGQNGGGVPCDPQQPIWTEVEWVIAMSPQRLVKLPFIVRQP